MFNKKATAARLRRWWLRFAPRSFLLCAHATPHELGEAGEELAARHLRRLGWTLRGRRHRTRAGEVDIWAWNGERSWVVEVKTGRVREQLAGSPGQLTRTWCLRFRPADSFTYAQRKRLRTAAYSLARRTRRRPGLTLVEVFVSLDGRRVEVSDPGPCLLGEN